MFHDKHFHNTGIEYFVFSSTKDVFLFLICEVIPKGALPQRQKIWKQLDII